MKYRIDYVLKNKNDKKLFAYSIFIFYFIKFVILPMSPNLFNSPGFTIFPHPVDPARKFNPLVAISAGNPKDADATPRALPVLKHFNTASPSFVKVLSGLTYELHGLYNADWSLIHISIQF